MEKGKRFLNLHYGNRGFFLSLDISIALFIVILILFVSLFFILKGLNDNISSLQQTKLANDLTAALDYNKKFDSLNKDIIKTNIQSILPENYNMSFRFECKDKIIQSLNQAPKDFVASGERVVVTNNLDFCVMRYWLW